MPIAKPIAKPTHLALAAALLAVAPVRAQTPEVAVTEAWARATPPGASVGAAYVTLMSPAGDTLLSASSPAAARVEVHEMRMDGSVMRMRELSGGMALPPGQAVTLQPGGLHIMMIGLKGPLKPGDTVPLHLVFQSGPPVDVVARVGAMGATAAPAP